MAACLNEAAGIERFMEAIERQAGVARLVLVDDGSSDGTPTLIQRRINGASACAISLIELTRNFGKEAAMLAGLDFARGRCGAVILIDSDLQHPPELIGSMIERWRQGAEMVTAIRDDRDQESRFRIASASGFYSVFNRLVDSIQLTDGAGDYRLLDAAVVEALTQMRESGRFSKGLYPWTGYRSVDLAYQRPPRASGRSSWNLRRLWIYALDGIFSFSLVPLRVWTGLGVLISLLSLVYAVVRVVWTLVRGIDVPGYASIIVAILFLGGIQLIGIGILGEYIGRIYVETKGRPLYFIRSVSGDSAKADSETSASYSRQRQGEA
ncbi:MAG: glycosyltransferase family 2 protein [Cyanobacteriota bacterium]|nr:glycosyltransferase family 2 protein [Cyanobacteriota bacterium]